VDGSLLTSPSENGIRGGGMEGWKQIVYAIRDFRTMLKLDLLFEFSSLFAAVFS
jgi:hypothetical protein